MVEYAFRWLGLHRYFVGCFQAIMGPLRRNRNVINGRKWKANWADGDWENIIDVTILEDEWVALDPKQASRLILTDLSHTSNPPFRSTRLIFRNA